MDDKNYLDRQEARRKLEEERKEKVEREKKILIVAVPAIAIILILVLIAVKFAPAEKKSDNEAKDAKIEQSSDNDSTDSDESETEDPLSLKKSDDEAINELVNNYFAAISACDVDKLQKYVDDIGDITADSLNANAQYIEAYENIECYTKPGLYDNTYIVYVYYENKILNIDTLAPGATTLYAIRDEETDTVCIHNGVTTGEIASYMETVSQEDDVAEFFANVDKKLEEACEADEDLNTFYKGLTKAVESETKTTEKSDE